MKKLHAFAFYALVTPVLTFGAGSLLAQSTDQDMDREQQSTQVDQGAAQSTQSDQSGPYPSLSDAPTAADRERESNQYGERNRNDMHSAAAKGMPASELIGAEVKTTDDEDVGPVEELLIDESGQVVAVVVGVGGFLGIGEKNVAIGWDEVTISGGTSASKTPDPASAEHDPASSGHDPDSEDDILGSDELDLRIDLTREDLTSAPEFEDRD